MLPYERRLNLRREFRHRVLAGQHAIGCGAASLSPILVEVFGHSGIDFALIDLEHSPTGPTDLRALVTAADAVGLPVLVRVASLQEEQVLQALDLGVAGVIVPHIGSAADAERLVQYAKYAPVGDRGMCPGIRSGGYGASGFGPGALPWVQQSSLDNEGTLLICLLEDAEAVKQAGDIAAVSGIDVLWCGFGDLSASLGIDHSDIGHPQLAAALDTIRQACAEHGTALMASAAVTPTPEYIQRLFDLGITMISLGQDASILRLALTQICTSAATAVPA